MPNYQKKILPHPDFYIVSFIKNAAAPYIIFIHGGPGYNCGILEYLIDKEHIFNTLKYNVVLYDQRNCGRSRQFNKTVSHSDNINDLNRITQNLIEIHNIKIIGFIGHSYGAKLLFDFYKKTNLKLPTIFISTANTIATPRINNLILDLSYIKEKMQQNIRKYYLNLNLSILGKYGDSLNNLRLFFKKIENAIIYIGPISIGMKKHKPFKK